MALLSAAFPELPDKTAQALAELVSRRSLSANVAKMAGLLALSGYNPEKAVEAALPIVNNPGVRKLLLVVDAFVDVRALAGQARCAPECAPMLGALSKQAMALKRAVATSKRPTQAKRSQHGTKAGTE